ncbi:MAG: deoxyribodipyrimidine photo-lyase [Rudaea sp.]
MIAIVWFRSDLRLDDNPALQAALRAGLKPLPVYIHAPDEEGAWRPGAASDAWRHRSLAALDADLRRRGSRLHFLHGPSSAALRDVVEATKAKAVFWNRRYEPAIEERDARIKRELRAAGVRADSFNGSLLIEPWEVQTKNGDPYRVFTPFWRMAQTQLRSQAPAPAPGSLEPSVDAPRGVSLEALQLAPNVAWDNGFWKRWQPGEAGAQAALRRFIVGAASRYQQSRDYPGDAGTSRLSPHLHFGEISPWRVADALSACAEAAGENAAAFERELGWREFAHHVLHHFPHTAEQNFNRRFDGFDWADVPDATLRAWQQGHTGVPIVDAGMRELWATGWMHNRVRMVVASFLTKNLRAHWLAGARWFWNTLVDADLASNSLGWQWVAGTGVDAAPYVRVFNPVLQSKRFDADGGYLAHWVPELGRLPVALRHEPWLDPQMLARLAPNYPHQPIVDLVASRSRALQAYRS